MQPEHDDLTQQTAVTCLVGVSEVVVDQLELTEVGDHRSRRSEAFQGMPVFAMVENPSVAATAVCALFRWRERVR
jgi:hypothetical protein